MSVAIWCVMVAAFLPLAFTAMAKAHSSFDNAQPRVYLEHATGWRRRAHWVQLNGFEAFPPFAAAVTLGLLARAPVERTDLLSIAFVVLRAIYGAFYLADLAIARTLVWLAATGCVVALFIGAATAH